MYATVRRTSMHLHIPVVYYSCCCSVCCYPAVAEAAVLLLAAAVRHRVPDGALCRCDLLHLIPVFFFVPKHDFFKCSPWQYCRMYSLHLPIIL